MTRRLPIWALMLVVCACAWQSGAQTARLEERVTLQGNTHPLARAEFDRGIAPDGLLMDRMELVLKQTPAQQAELQKFLQDVQDKSSANYHKWLTPEQFGARFGASQGEIANITNWLTANGFTVAKVAAGRTSIEFSGTAAQVRNSFNSEIHKYLVSGEEHWANASNPQIPAAFSSLVAGVATLHNFRAKPQHRMSSQVVTARKSTEAGGRPEFTAGANHALAPADVKLIYNVNVANTDYPVIGIVARSNIHVQDVVDFSNAFGLNMQPINVILNGPDPGDLGGGEEVEAVIDVTWSGAMAPGATVDMVISASTNSTDGLSLSELYLVDNNLASLMSESFGACEAEFTAAQEAFVALLAEQAAAQGITYLVAAGDSGSAGCDNPTVSPATGPISVNGLASTPYNIAVGGTEFNENGNASAYWSATTADNGGSALSYIPEDVWNESDASSLYAGGGGRSVYFSKPPWQVGVPGIPADGARDLPDVSLSAALHDPYLICIQGSCTPTKSGEIKLAAVGGTSVSTPVFAGILANVYASLLQLTANGSALRQGQIAPILYALASTAAFSICNGSYLGGLPAANCIFNDITVGNNAVPGESGPVQYPAAAGYDLASGLGSVNAANLASAWLSVGGTYATSENYYPQSVGSADVGASMEIQLSFLVPGPATPTFTLRYANEFNLTAQNCTLSYYQKELCAVSVVFTPKYAGTRQDALVASLALGSPQTIPLVGVGQAPEVALIPGAISTFAGNGMQGNSGDGGTAVSAALNQPWAVSLDPVGDVYIADTQNSAIRKVDVQTGSITTYAGNGREGFSGDGGPAAQAQLSQPQGVAVDGAGNVYIADTGNSLVRKVDALSGEITTVVGNGTYGLATNNGSPVQTALGSPSALAFDSQGNLYICDEAFSSVWEVYTSGSEIHLVAGNGTSGYSGDGGAATSAALDYPVSIAMDANDALYIADFANNVIGKVTNGFISTIAGTGTAGYSGDFGPAIAAQLNAPAGVAVDAAGNLYIADTNNGVIRLLNSATGLISTVAGNRTFSDSGDGGPATAAGLKFPVDLALDGAGDLFVTTQGNVVREVKGNPGMLTFAATPAGGTSAPQTAYISNIGNLPLAISSIGLSAGFTQVTPAATPQCTAGIIDSGTIASGALCAIAVEETPSSNMTPTGSIYLTDNNLGLNASHQPVLLNLPGSASDAWLVDIDVPASPDDPLQGPVMFSGWAIDAESVVSGVSVSIDGVVVGQAFYGAFRTDVCAVYPGSHGCPNIGWSLVYNTQLLANGSHLLQVTAEASDGSKSVAARTFNVANWSTADPTHIDVDYPSASATTFSGTASFGGWIVDDDAPVSKVAISIDGSPVGNATYGIYRADVCAAFPGRPGCPNVGWAFNFDTTQLADGQHKIELTATVNSDRKFTASATFTVNNAASNNPTSRPVHVDIDLPGPLGASLSGQVTISGWAVDDAAGVTNVALSIDGATLGSATYGIYRGDVCAVFPGRTGCPNVGWIYTLDTTGLANGTHTVSVTASGLNSQATAARMFAVSNDGGSFVIDIDNPNALSGPLTGLQLFSGWAISHAGAVNMLSYAIDGVPCGPVSYGEYRADVCALYPSAGCPAVGWFVYVDTGQLSAGTHTLALTAYSGTESRTVTTNFTVSNWTAANPIRMSIDVPAVNASLSGVVSILGWALDTAEQVAQVTYSVDGSLPATASYGGSRADACAVYPNSPGCPFVGWSAGLNTTLLTNGAHTLAVTVTSLGGVSYTESTSFVVHN